VGGFITSAFTEAIGDIREKPLKKLKITVVQRLVVDTGDGVMRPCKYFQDNQVIMVESLQCKPEKLCDTGWDDMQSFLHQVDNGKTSTAFCRCTGSHPVIFKIEQVE
jgi:uncharacterized repeat protein (TIGR04076 family)